MKNSDYPEYGSWANMRSRCLNPNLPQYKNYGGRGVTVCDRWADFQAFLADVGPRPSQQHTLERIDNDKGYEPGNVEWATRKQQANNTRRCKWYEWQGQRLNIAQLAEMAGLPRVRVWKRLKAGWSVEDAIRPIATQ